MEMLSTELKKQISSEYPYSFIGEILEDFQLEHVNDTSQCFDDVHKDFVNFLIQERPHRTKPTNSHKSSSTRSCDVETDSTKMSSERESSEYSIIHTDDEIILNTAVPSMSLADSQKTRQEAGFINDNTVMWVSVE
ncbi:hypothetical protein K493DRAFT_311931 [Basidiobolus meristosporus CBS 931.73]|uniref:Uncharacterized protein n=1 Tax=Basidiobolus meristosporus CBS 931.73 TaxID=1314790 RepID=A0A1Y1YYD5_9FUNG|nr:hypothetical protein K493DRAFT_311931 [Basidiobolus meristosporus CBS 931.73]|eukprot:ORY02894.1 hypothetical protein K493DRAFT_311931 [Basidiobolus meristosporus CBS 931.73]